MNFSKNSGKKKAAAAAVVCFVAAIAITGTYTFNNYKESKNENDLAMAEEIAKEKYTVSSEEEPLVESVDGDIRENDVDTISDENSNSDANEPADKDINNTLENEDDSVTMGGFTEEASISNTTSVNFSENSLMLWPVSGSLLMDYSMDKTVYFKTLDQYKYNPAIIIGAAENDQVIAGVSGLVKSIDNSAQTGTTVNVDLGNGYEAFYGQLQNVTVKTGDFVEATTTLGYVAEPTKYYSSEGSNLYFAMRKDGRPVNPKEYLTDYVE